jgi:hypothetical protein
MRLPIFTDLPFCFVEVVGVAIQVERAGVMKRGLEENAGTYICRGVTGWHRGVTRSVTKV